MEADDVRTREDLEAFLTELAESARTHPESIENIDLPTYLEAASGWVADMDGWFRNQGLPTPDQPSWTIIAQILSAATLYE